MANALLFSRAPAGSWRGICRATIAEALEGTEGLSEDQVIERIGAAYPFGERKYYPYKVWLEERRAAIGRLHGVYLSAGVSSVEAREALRTFVPDPELEGWLSRAGRRAAGA